MVLGRGRHPKGEATGSGGGGAPGSGKTPSICFPAESVSVDEKPEHCNRVAPLCCN